MGLGCSVCDHPQHDSIDSLISVGVPSQRVIARQFGLTQGSIDRHKRNGHIGQRIAKAVERSEQKADDVFMQRHEQLWAETAQYVQDAKGAVKMQKVSVAKLNAEGDEIGTEDRYQAFRDVGAMAPALQTAVQLQRVLGDATARFSSAVPAGATNVYLSVVLPRGLEQAAEFAPALEVTAVPVLEPALEPATDPTE